jgi:hypothetical protein
MIPETSTGRNCVPEGELSHRDLAQRQLALLQHHFLNRTDLLCHWAAWAKPCPLETSGNLDDLLLSHLLGSHGPAVSARWTTSRGKSGTAHGPFRLGSYSPALDGTTLFACIDLDGGGHSHPLLEPLEAALRVVAVLTQHGLEPYLERSKSGNGWHIWVFFSVPVPASQVRRVLLDLLPNDLPLCGGDHANASTNTGLELFPKQDQLGHTGARVGTPLWLPWWHGATYPNNQFHQVPGDTVEPYQPEAFTTVPPDLLADLERQLSHPGTNKATVQLVQARPAVAVDTHPDQGGSRVSGQFLIQRALERIQDRGRNDTGFWLACQLRDNGYTQPEAEEHLQAYAEHVANHGGHPYKVEEAQASLASAYQLPARQPWGRVHQEERTGALSALVCSSSSCLNRLKRTRSSFPRPTNCSSSLCRRARLAAAGTRHARSGTKPTRATTALFAWPVTAGVARSAAAARPTDTAFTLPSSCSRPARLARRW